MRLLVCGGRDYSNVAVVHHALHSIHTRRGIALLIEGGARGADRLARLWAQQNGVPYETYDADWKKYGNAAGPIRNGRMLKEGKPDGVLAFPGERGTNDMMEQASMAGVPVKKVGWPTASPID